MNCRKTYLNLFAPLLLCGMYLIVHLFGQIIYEQKQEQALYLLTAEVPFGEISREVLEEMQEFPGFCRMWMSLTEEVEISAEDYKSGGKLEGVDLISYPLRIIRSGGQKALGTKLLLVIGEDFLKRMTDQNGRTISARQAGKLLENIETLTLKLKIGGEEEEKESEVLGIAEGGGVYADAAQMRTWLSDEEVSAGISRVCMEIRGKSHGSSARKTLEDAGFICQIWEWESSSSHAFLSLSSGVR